MKKTKRILCALLAVMLIIPMALVSVNAAEAEKPLVSLDSLGWKEINSKYSAPAGKYQLTVSDNATMGSNSLHYLTTKSAMTHIELVSAETLAQYVSAGDTYSISYDILMEACYDWAGIGFGADLSSGNEANAQGHWVIFRNNYLDMESYVNGSKSNEVKYSGGAMSRSAKYSFKIDVNTTGTVTVYINGAQAMTGASACNAIGDIFTVVYGGSANPTSFFLDNLKVTKGDTVIYSEDFEGYAVNDAQPADGTVLYAENFGSGLHWQRFYGTYCGGTNPYEYDYTLTAEDRATGDKWAHLKTNTHEGWTFLEIVPRDVMQSAIKTGDVYTIEYDLKLEAIGDWLVFGFGKQAINNADGNWVVFRSQTYDGGKHSYVQNYTSGFSTAKGHFSTLFDWSKVQTVKITADTANGTYSVSLDGTPVVTNFTASHNTIDSFYVGVYGTTSAPVSFFVDNVKVEKVVDGGENVLVAFDDFNSYSSSPDYYAQGSYVAAHLGAGVTYQNGDGKFFINQMQNSRWTEYKLVPSKAVTNVDKYTISFTLVSTLGTTGGTCANPIKGTINWNGGPFVRFGGATMSSSSNGAWVRFAAGTNTTIDFREDYDIQRGTNKVDTTGAYPLCNKEMDVAIEVDTIAKIAKVYVDGTLMLTSTTFNKIDVADIYFGCDYWTSMYVDDIVVTAGVRTDEPATYIGAQETGVDNGTYNVRFVASLGKQFEYTDYENVGLKITCGNKTWNTPCQYVYDSVTGGENVGDLETYSASTYGAKYLMAYTIKGIPASAGKLTFTVTPYFETAAGTAYGTSYTVVYNAGQFVSSTIAH